MTPQIPQTSPLTPQVSQTPPLPLPRVIGINSNDYEREVENELTINGINILKKWVEYQTKAATEARSGVLYVEKHIHKLL
jgi:hypothetical protein